MERRTFLRSAIAGAGALAFSGATWDTALAAPAQPGTSPYGALGAADASGVQLPAGFTSRIVARSGQAVSGTSYTWHGAPDGGACFANGSGWIYVSNSELGSSTGGASRLIWCCAASTHGTRHLDTAAVARGSAWPGAIAVAASTAMVTPRTSEPEGAAPGRFSSICPVGDRSATALLRNCHLF
jgi:hypothetical protein